MFNSTSIQRRQNPRDPDQYTKGSSAWIICTAYQNAELLADTKETITEEQYEDVMKDGDVIDAIGVVSTNVDTPTSLTILADSRLAFPAREMVTRVSESIMSVHEESNSALLFLMHMQSPATNEQIEQVRKWLGAHTDESGRIDVVNNQNLVWDVVTNGLASMPGNFSMTAFRYAINCLWKAAIPPSARHVRYFMHRETLDKMTWLRLDTPITKSEYVNPIAWQIHQHQFYDQLTIHMSAQSVREVGAEWINLAHAHLYPVIQMLLSRGFTTGQVKWDNWFELCCHIYSDNETAWTDYIARNSRSGAENDSLAELGRMVYDNQNALIFALSFRYPVPAVECKIKSLLTRFQCAVDYVPPNLYYKRKNVVMMATGSHGHLYGLRPERLTARFSSLTHIILSFIADNRRALPKLNTMLTQTDSDGHNLLYHVACACDSKTLAVCLDLYLHAAMQANANTGAELLINDGYTTDKDNYHYQPGYVAYQNTHIAPLKNQTRCCGDFRSSMDRLYVYQAITYEIMWELIEARLHDACDCLSHLIKLIHKDLNGTRRRVMAVRLQQCLDYAQQEKISIDKATIETLKTVIANNPPPAPSTPPKAASVNHHHQRSSSSKKDASATSESNESSNSQKNDAVAPTSSSSSSSSSQSNSSSIPSTSNAHTQLNQMRSPASTSGEPPSVVPPSTQNTSTSSSIVSDSSLLYDHDVSPPSSSSSSSSSTAPIAAAASSSSSSSSSSTAGGDSTNATSSSSSSSSPSTVNVNVMAIEGDNAAAADNAAVAELIAASTRPPPPPSQESSSESSSSSSSSSTLLVSTTTATPVTSSTILTAILNQGRSVKLSDAETMAAISKLSNEKWIELNALTYNDQCVRAVEEVRAASLESDKKKLRHLWMIVTKRDKWSTIQQTHKRVTRARTTGEDAATPPSSRDVSPSDVSPSRTSPPSRSQSGIADDVINLDDDDDDDNDTHKRRMSEGNAETDQSKKQKK